MISTRRKDVMCMHCLDLCKSKAVERHTGWEHSHPALRDNALDLTFSVVHPSSPFDFGRLSKPNP